MRQALEHALYIGVGGFLGANARYFLSLGIGALLGRNFPFGTLIINVSGSFLLAVFLAWVARQVHFEEAVRLVGRCWFLWRVHDIFVVRERVALRCFRTGTGWQALFISLAQMRCVCSASCPDCGLAASCRRWSKFCD